ncbi:MAG: antibiotic biosynthesis monooxygenase [Pseudomonadota bacterium]
MLAVLLAFDVKPGSEAEFVETWEHTTHIIYQHFGGLGSRLHRSEDGQFIAYAQWPDLEVYESEQIWTDEHAAVRQQMRNTLIGGRPASIRILSVVSDLIKDYPCDRNDGR